MRILCIGLNHKTADVELRERLAFDDAQARRALNELTDTWTDAEFVVLSTCNRSELYTARPVHGHPREEELRGWLGKFHALDISQFDRALYTLADGQAAEHLFAVAAGLDSMVPGEAQIVGQLRATYAMAVESGAAGPVMNELFQTAFHAAKQIRTQTGVSRGKASVASVAVDCVAGALETLAGKCILSIGAGKMNTLMIRQMAHLGADRILVANRSRARARQLAKTCGGQVASFSALADHLVAADVVLTSTAAEAPILTRKMIASAQRRRRWRPLLIVDIAVPRDVEASAGGLKTVFLYNIDDLEQVVRATLKRRQGHRPAAEKIIAEHVREFLRKLNIREVSPTIDVLYRHMRRIAAEELKAARNRLSSHDDADADVEILQRALHRAIRRIMHPCVKHLRDEAGTDAARAHVASLRKLFGLSRQ